MASPSTFIIGGSGKVAQQITRILTSQTTPAHKVFSVIRSESHVPSLKSLGATPIIQSIEDATVADIANTITSCEPRPSTIIFAAGAGGGNPARTDKVDREGAIKTMDAAVAAGVKRYIIISAVDVRDRDGKPAPDWYNDADKEKSDRMWKALGPYMKAKLAADRDLRTVNTTRSLQYTIVRPGSLSNDPGRGSVSAGKIHIDHPISREDVARVVIRCMSDESTAGLAFDVVGGDTPIDEAITKIASTKEDTFEAHY